jgi:hypothetical protein
LGGEDVVHQGRFCEPTSLALINAARPSRYFPLFLLALGREVWLDLGWIFTMGTALAIKRMSREEKLRAMEALWEDLTQDEAEVDSPGWHGEALRQTEQLVRAGKAKFSDWQAAKRRVRRKAERAK